MRNWLFYIFLVFSVTAAYAQSTGLEERKHLIYFTDKANSPYQITQPQVYLSTKAIARRERQHIPITLKDLPVNPAYVAGLKEQEGVKLWYTSRWFNAAVVECTPDKLEELLALPYVRSSQTLNRTAFSEQIRQQVKALENVPAVSSSILLDTADYGLAFHQADMLGVIQLHEAGFRGEGLSIAVLDAGFPSVNTISAFSHLFQNQNLLGTFDFVAKQENVFHASSHGTAVLSTMAAYEPGRMIGTAYEANYYLLRTENAASEHHIEEVNWLLAAEYADSAGADVINSSLGYNLFDEPSIDYTYSQMDGNTTIVSKAADFAAATGMLVVVSAGNDGASSWRYIAAPADADSVLAVGAVDSLGRRAPFSSFGPTADGQIKPDVVALGWNAYVLNSNGALVKSIGTSFSSPIMAGMATILWQANAGKTNMELIRLIRSIGSNATAPDNTIGYGIPKANKTLTSVLPPRPQQDFHVTNPVTSENIKLFLPVHLQQKEAVVHIYDVKGKLIYKQELPPHQPQHVLLLNPAVLQKGMYLCRLHTNGNMSTVRFVKL
ncbi:S8 family serine peptidase [Pontibacter harenae]|uniref:S8 family serine peptidase n=1 Tax=Pontibacter harenae TaxID=2894083 RepID=UPI001E616BB0|nr:S8 family serine peptidase [Pontibacter harenae]MCC9167401.1 S8 family serine peptidase [Pontibacter harenae]